MRFAIAFLLLLITVLPSQSPAEIRMFLLRIAKKGNPQDYRLVKSSLDPLQYKYFYTVMPDEIVTYDDTWRCTGRTGDFQPACPSPRELASEKPPSEGPEK